MCVKLVIQRYKLLFTLFITISDWIFNGCSSEKNNFISRNYHTFVSYFNGFYHATQRFKEGVKLVEKSYTIPLDTFHYLVPDLKPPPSDAVQLFDQAIKKCDVIIFRHKNGRYVDDCRFLNGKCRYYKNQLPLAIQHFEYILIAFPNSPLKPEVLYWLARSQYHQENYFAALQTLNNLFEISDIDDKVKKQAYELYATILLKQNDFAGATGYLRRILQLTRKKKEKVPVYYLLGQIYERQGDISRAYRYYEGARIKKSMTTFYLNSTLSQVRLLIDNAPSDASFAEPYHKLKKLERSGRFRPYRDQIYYWLSQMALKKHQPAIAKKYLFLSLQYSKENQIQKTKTYHQLAQLYFFYEHKIDSAMAYYDSAATTAPPDFPKKKEIQQMSSILKEWKHQKDIISHHDSLLKLSYLPRPIVEKKLKDYLKQKEEERRRSEEEKQQQMMASSVPFQSPNSSGVDFYFDNPQRVQQGIAEFQRIWGQRKNEDHWRRSRKNLAFSSGNKTGNSVSTSSQLNSTSNHTSQTSSIDEQVEELLKSIPQTDEERKKLIEEMENAYLRLAQIFYEDLHLPDSAIAVYLEFEKKFKESVHLPHVYYACYLIYSELGENTKAQTYKYKLLHFFPNSPYALLIQGNYQQDSTLLKDFERAYTTLFTLYDNGEYQSVIGFSDFMKTKFFLHPEFCKVLLLKGAAFGKLGKKDSLEHYFAYVSENYGGTECAKYAQQTLAYLKGKEPEVKTQAQSSQSKSQQVAVNDQRFAGFLLKQSRSEKMLVVLLIDKNKISANEIKIQISNFNRTHFANEAISANVFVYQGKHLVYISQFPDAPSAHAYLTALLSSTNLRQYLNDPETEAFFISPSNFRTAFSQKRMHDYGAFYKKYKEQMLQQVN